MGPKDKQTESDSLFGAMRRAVQPWLDTSAKHKKISGWHPSATPKFVSQLLYLFSGNLCLLSVVGRSLANGTWLATPLNDFHNANNPAEIARIENEHPGELVIQNNRVLGTLSVTRGEYS